MKKNNILILLVLILVPIFTHADVGPKSTWGFSFKYKNKNIISSITNCKFRVCEENKCLFVDWQSINCSKYSDEEYKIYFFPKRDEKFVQIKMDINGHSLESNIAEWKPAANITDEDVSNWYSYKNDNIKRTITDTRINVGITPTSLEIIGDTNINLIRKLPIKLQLIFAVISTSIIELLILWIYAKVNNKIELTSKKFILVFIITNIITVSALWLVFPFIEIGTKLVTLLSFEFIIFAIEGLIYYLINKQLTVTNAVILSFIANASSFLIGWFCL